MPDAPPDAVVLADSPHAGTVVLGLTLRERGRRVAGKLGAERVFVVDGPAAAAALAAWRAERAAAPLVIVRAGDQLVHPPLVEPLRGGTAERRIAVGPDGAYAGALWASGAAAAEAIEAIAASPAGGDAELAARWSDAERIPHGELARHPATTPAERKAAARMLLRVLVKAEDSPITRYLTRPMTRPLTRLLVATPVTANQVTFAAGLIGLFGCWFTAQPGRQHLIAGAALVLLASFIDDCDGGLSRLRLTSSRLGAWLDTIVDELTTTVYLVAIGYHTYLRHPDLPWIVPSIAVGLACYLASVYGIYYFLIVVSKTGNSQHYVGDLEIVEGASGVGLRARRRTPSASPWLRRLGGVLALVVRRDFITLASFAAALLDGYFAIYLTMLTGGVITAIVVVPEHLRLRRQLREVARRGAAPRLV